MARRGSLRRDSLAPPYLHPLPGAVCLLWPSPVQNLGPGEKPKATLFLASRKDSRRKRDAKASWQVSSPSREEQKAVGLRGGFIYEERPFENRRPVPGR